MPIVRPPSPEPINTTPLEALVNTLGSILVDGAQIDEALDSDAGNVLTLDRKQVVKRYIVRVPTIQDKPLVYLRRAFPIGSPYPGNQSDYAGLIVYGYDEGERINESETAWHSTVIYSTLDQLAVLNWVTEGEFSEEQEHIEYDASEQSLLIGTPVYDEKVAGFPAAIYTAPNRSGQIVHLQQSSAYNVTGLDRYRGVHRFAMIRTLFVLTWTQIRAVGTRVGTVNSSTFLTYEPGELLFLNFGWREVFGLFPSTQSTTNKNVEVRLQFTANSDRWSPVRKYHEYAGDEGWRSPVTGPGGGRVYNEFEAYQYSDFIGIFNILNTTAPGVL